MSMAIMTTTNIHLFQSEWRHLYMSTQMSHLCRTLQKGICPWHIHRTLSVLKILVDGDLSYSNLRSCIFKHSYLTNLSVTLEDVVIAVAENLPQALETSKPQHLWVSTIQAALKDLLEVFTDKAHKYIDDPAIHTSPSGAYGISKGASHSP
jgi:hypothetical protein